ncbi:MAG TPA: endonuclease/exonuclease/phosphatase family protein [Candidatus Limnocylindrales bacterium]|nr:endonuclease/exonuclease/phosphatase family protein [Candidatus Limnocylindrales bacterium]
MRAAGETAARSPGLRLVSWNIRAAIGPGEPFPPAWWRHVRRDRLEGIAAFVRALDADVAVLQEVPLATADGAPLDEPRDLEALTGMTVRYAALHHYTLVEPGGRVVGATLWGNALLTRLPIAAATVHALPVPADDDLVEPPGAPDPPAANRTHPLAGVRYVDAGQGPREARCVLDCTIEAGLGPIRVLSTHLAYVGRAQRLAQAEEIARLVGPSERVVVAGDLNAAVDDPELAPLAAALTDAFVATGTPPGDRHRESCGRQAIDHVFVKGLRPVVCRVAREAGDLSDHWPVVADLGPS